MNLHVHDYGATLAWVGGGIFEIGYRRGESVGNGAKRNADKAVGRTKDCGGTHAADAGLRVF